LNRRERVAFDLLRPINPSFIIVLGVYTVLWGLWLANPFWTVFTHAALYSALSFFPETVIGLVAIAAGLLIMRGAMKPSLKNLKMGTFTGTLFWSFISIAYFIGDWANTGGITAGMIAVYSGLTWVNVKVNGHLYD